MTAEDRQNQELWIFGGVFLFLSLCLFGFHGWMKFFALQELKLSIAAEHKIVQELKGKQETFLKNELRDLFSRYSEGVSAVSSIMAARDDVFSGAVNDDTAEPVVILDVPDFLLQLQRLLGKQMVLSNLEISRTGQVSFLIETMSYLSSAKQISALRLGLASERKKKSSADGDELAPPLFIDMEVTSVGKNDVTGTASDIPEIFRQLPATYRFIVQAKLNPEYYVSSQ